LVRYTMLLSGPSLETTLAPMAATAPMVGTGPTVDTATRIAAQHAPPGAKAESSKSSAGRMQLGACKTSPT
jgi:hypothetical protein